MTNFLAELRRRNVFRVAAAYLVVGWVIMQVVGTIGGAAGLPDWADSLALILLITAFPIILFIAWAFELTPEGLKKTDAAAPDAPVKPLGSRDIVLIAMLIVVAGIAGTQIATRAPAVAPALVAAEPDEPVAAQISDASIAVLPFADLSQAGDQQYFSDGISEEILNVLVRVQGLDVASRTSAFQFRGDTMGIPEIAGRLGVRHVLEGSVRKDGETIRITAQLIDARDDRHLWSQTFDRPFTAGSLFAIQDEIANAIVSALRGVLDVGDAPAIEVVAITDDVDAYSLYLEARTLFQARSRLDHVDQLLERALQIDPEFSEAWEMRAAVVALAKEYGFTDISSDEVARLTELYAGRALALNPESSMALAVLAKLAMNRSTLFSTRADWTQIANQYARAVALDPRNASARLWQGIAFGRTGHLQAALESFEACLRAEPSYRPCRENQIDTLASLGRDDEALIAIQQSLEAGTMTAQFANLPLLARTGERTQFLWATNNENLLLGWNGQVELYEALRHANGPDEALAGRVREFVARNPGRNPAGIAAALLTISSGGQEFLLANMPLYFFDSHFRSVRSTPWFRTWLRETGILAYWQEEGFPDLCRPVGSDDFECD